MCHTHTHTNTHTSAIISSQDLRLTWGSIQPAEWEGGRRLEWGFIQRSWGGCRETGRMWTHTWGPVCPPSPTCPPPRWDACSPPELWGTERHSKITTPYVFRAYLVLSPSSTSSFIIFPYIMEKKKRCGVYIVEAILKFKVTSSNGQSHSTHLPPHMCNIGYPVLHCIHLHFKGVLHRFALSFVTW